MGESLIVWFTRIHLPHEFRDMVYHVRDPIDIEEFVFSERQIARTSPKGLASAHYMYGCFLQVGLATDTPDTKRAHWHPAQMDNTQGQTTHPPFKQRFVARITPVLDVPRLRRLQPEEPPLLFHVPIAMPPETRLRLVRELELCTQAKLE